MEVLFVFCMTMFMLLLFILPIALIMVALGSLWMLVKSNRKDVPNDLQ